MRVGKIVFKKGNWMIIKQKVQYTRSDIVRSHMINHRCSPPKKDDPHRYEYWFPELHYTPDEPTCSGCLSKAPKGIVALRLLAESDVD